LISGNNIFAGTSQGIYLSTNKGTSWTLVSTGVYGVLCFAIEGNNIYAGTGNGIYLTFNNGNTWNLISGNIPNTHILSLAKTGSNIFAGTQNGLFSSTDNGNTWTVLDNGIPTNVVVISLTINGSNIYAATNLGVFLSGNEGRNWQNVNDGLGRNLVNTFAINGTSIYAGTNGAGVWKRDLSEMVGLNDIKNNDHHLNIYPNPTKGKFTINSNEKISSVEVYNLIGEKIYTNTNLTSNEIDLTNISKGIYFVKIFVGAKTHIEKIVIE